MKENDPKDILDRAYDYLLSGKNKEAATCFQEVVNNANKYGAYAARIAQQRILWYCVPLDTILAEMEECNCPVDVHAVIKRIFASDERYNESENQNVIKTIEGILAKNPLYVRVGKRCWIYRSDLEEIAHQFTAELRQVSIPVSLASIYKKAWPEYYLQNPSFPDQYSLSALSDALEKNHINVFADKFVIPDRVFSYTSAEFARRIEKAGRPLCLLDEIPQIFPDLSEVGEHLSLLENQLSINLDTRFVEFTPGCYITTSLLQFHELPFTELFSTRYVPLPLESMLSFVFPEFDQTLLTSSAKNYISTQFSQNTHLICIEANTWFSRKRLREIQKQAMDVLYAQEKHISIPDLARVVAPINLNLEQQNLFQTVILAAIQSSPNALQVASNFWIHKEKLSALADLAYKYLITRKQEAIENIAQEVFFNGERTDLAKQFITAFDTHLRHDRRFALLPNNKKIWRAVPPGQRDNDIIYSLLTRKKNLLTEEEILKELDLTDPEFDLEADSRFKTFIKNRWGLDSWIFLNDYAYEYLLDSREALHKNVIVGLICTIQGFHEDQVFFLPEEDPRFAQDSLNRWFCRYQLTPEDREKLLAELDKYAGAGRRLDLLLQPVLRKNPDETDAEFVLPSDSRFICLDNLWYSFHKVYRQLSSEDIQKIYSYLCQQPLDSAAISIKDCGLQALGWDGRLTNAAELMSQDNRFIERHPGFWALTSWSPPGHERLSIGGISVGTSGFADDKPDGETVEVPEKLTRRKARKKSSESTDDEQKRHYHILSYLDILHGNIRIAGALKKWVPEGSKTILLIDNQKNECVSYVDETTSILNIRDWIQMRGLTYGDKIYFEQTTTDGNLFVRPYGKRDQRVYREAITHQDIEKLIEQARSVKMTYHDLMIKIMESFDFPLHREDIFQMVDYERTALRSTIFELLSLTDCPYEELRYFVPQGRGYWSFDRQRKKAYDMKMKELLEENNALKDQLASLLGSKEDTQPVSARFEDLKQKIALLQQSLKTGSEEKEARASQIKALDREKDLTDQLNQQLQSDLNQVQKQLAELHQTHTASISELNALRAQQTLFEEQEAKLHSALEELKSFGQLKVSYENNADQVHELQNTLTEKEAQISRLKAESQSVIDQLENQVAELSGELDDVKNQLNEVKDVSSNFKTEVADLNLKREQLEEELASSKEEAQKQIAELQNQLSNAEVEKADICVRLKNTIQSLSEEQYDRKVLEEKHEQAQEQIKVLEAKVADNSKAWSEKQVTLAANLDERVAALQTLEAQITAAHAEKKALEDGLTAKNEQLARKVTDLKSQINTIRHSYDIQASELQLATARLERVNRALSTPIGRLFARIQGLTSIRQRDA